MRQDGDGPPVGKSEVLLDVDPEAQRAAALDARLILPGAVP